MIDHRLLYFVLGVLTVVGLGALGLRSDGIEFPDGTVQTTAASADPRRAFYLTQSRSDGASPLTACALGFHMASLWEIHDVSTLRYATEEPDALSHADSGVGPPANNTGWVRTGWVANVDTTTGRGNCDAWTSNDAAHWGSTVSLKIDWVFPVAPWEPGVRRCDVVFQRAWCVVD